MSRKGENIYKRKDGRWEGRYIKSRTASGKAIYGYIYAKTYKEAKEKVSIQRMLQSIPAEISEAETGTEKFDDIAMEWLNAIQPNVKESTGNKYLNSLNSYILPMFQGRKHRSLHTISFLSNAIISLNLEEKKVLVFHRRVFLTYCQYFAIFYNTLNSIIKLLPVMHVQYILDEVKRKICVY